MGSWAYGLVEKETKDGNLVEKSLELCEIYFIGKSYGCCSVSWQQARTDIKMISKDLAEQAKAGVHFFIKNEKLKMKRKKKR